MFCSVATRTRIWLYIYSQILCCLATQLAQGSTLFLIAAANQAAPRRTHCSSTLVVVPGASVYTDTAKAAKREADSRQHREVGGPLTLKRPRKYKKRGVGVNKQNGTETELSNNGMRNETVDVDEQNGTETSRSNDETREKAADSTGARTETRIKRPDDDERLSSDRNGNKRTLRRQTIENKLENERLQERQDWRMDRRARRQNWGMDQLAERQNWRTDQCARTAERQDLQLAEGQRDWSEVTHPSVAKLDSATIRGISCTSNDSARTTTLENAAEGLKSKRQPSRETGSQAVLEAEARALNEGTWGRKEGIKREVEEARKKEEIAFFLGFLIATFRSQLTLQARLGNLQYQVSSLVQQTTSMSEKFEGLEASQHAPPHLRKQRTPESSADSEPVVTDPTPSTATPLAVPTAPVMAGLACCRVPLPAPGAPGAPCFVGKNVTDFLETFDNLCDDHGVVEADRLKKVVRYCEFKTREYVQTLIDDEEGWESFKKQLKEEYEKEDIHQQRQTRIFLERLCSIKREENDRSLKDYCRQFAATYRALVKKGQLDEYTGTRLFLTGLPPKLQRRVVVALEIDPKDETTMRFKPAVDKTMKYLETEECLTFLKESPTQKREIEKLASIVRGPQNDGLEFDTDPVMSAKGTSDSAVEQLTKQIGALVVPMQAVVSQMGRQSMAAPRVAGSAVVVEGTPATGANTVPLGARYDTGTFICYFCGENGHTRPRCRKFQQMFNAGEIHVNDDRRIAWGKRRPDAPELRRVDGKTAYEVVQANIEDRESRQRSGAQVNYLRVSLGADSESEAELENEYDAIDSVAGVYAAQAGAAQKGKGKAAPRNLEKPVQDKRFRATKAVAEKEKEYPVMKAQRIGQYEEVVAGPSRAQEDAGSIDEDREQTVSQGEAGPQRKPRVPRQKLSKMLKNMTDPYVVAEAMLQKSIELPMHDLLSLSPQLQHVFFGSWPDPAQQQPAAKVNNVSAAVVNPEILEGKNVRFADKLYTAASPKMTVEITGKPVVALLDSGAEVTVMSRSLAQTLGLPISENVSLNMLAPEGRESKFSGICTAVSVSIGEITHRLPIWIVEKLGQNIILGRTYSRLARMRLEDLDDGTCLGTVWSLDGNAKVSFCACQADEEENRTRADLVQARALNGLAEV
ncbi:hypothetical protein GJ744_005634 [Endocarpon pusillum]|uniref:CCHC-type domain-containing protein n=1 Tax=Endocarpon pusillum TaxID=364733 RepID=A0A8H7DZH9_9EURO|nr:hypothetical protein GJ744_005634 [Endocarpon pusillum]